MEKSCLGNSVFALLRYISSSTHSETSHTANSKKQVATSSKTNFLPPPPAQDIAGAPVIAVGQHGDDEDGDADDDEYEDGDEDDDDDEEEDDNDHGD